MQLRSRAIVPLALLVAFLHSANAKAQVVDQQQLVVRPGGLALAAWVGETFKPTASTVAGAGVNILNYARDGAWDATLTAQLWTGIPGGSSRLLASGTTSVSRRPTGGVDAEGIEDVFWSAVDVTPGQEYFLAFHTTDGGQHRGVATWGYDYVSPYPQFVGSYRDGVLASMNAISDDPYAGPWDSSTFPNFDLTFREYSTSAVTPTPEPASIALVGTGLIGLGGIVRRRRQHAR